MSVLSLMPCRHSSVSWGEDGLRVVQTQLLPMLPALRSNSRHGNITREIQLPLLLLLSLPLGLHLAALHLLCVLTRFVLQDWWPS